MIVGMGCDLANIGRIETAIEKFGNRFVNKIFSEAEQAEMQRRGRISSREYACTAAKRFAAKEACSKALGTGLQKGTFWRDMEVTHLSGGKPVLKLYNGAAAHLARLCEGGEANVLVTMTDDYPWAQAFVVIEKIQGV